LKRLVVFALGFVEQAADEPIVQIEKRVGEGRVAWRTGVEAVIRPLLTDQPEHLNSGCDLSAVPGANQSQSIGFHSTN